MTKAAKIHFITMIQHRSQDYHISQFTAFRFLKKIKTLKHQLLS